MRTSTSAAYHSVPAAREVSLSDFLTFFCLQVRRSLQGASRCSALAVLSCGAARYACATPHGLGVMCTWLPVQAGVHAALDQVRCEAVLKSMTSLRGLMA